MLLTHMHTGSQQLAASLGTESPSLKTTHPTQSTTIFVLFKKRRAVLLFNCLKKEVGGGISSVSLALLLGRCSFCPLGTPFSSHLSPWHTGQHHARCRLHGHRWHGAASLTKSSAHAACGHQGYLIALGFTLSSYRR